MKKEKTAAVMEAQVNGGELKNVLLDDITISSTNKMFRDESDFTIGALQELVDSIRENGIVSPVLLRRDPIDSYKYILVAGERRYHASRFVQAAFKDRNTIPAYIRPLTEEQAFDLQLTENVERKDIHPMREAKAYEFLHKEKGWSTAEIAARFAKGETYVLQRLRLTALITEAQNDFVAGAMTLGHALEIARLQPQDQAEVVKSCQLGNRENRYYEHISELREFIADNITMELKNAPFDTKDASIVPKAGACTTCLKRSGAQSMLFSDVVEKDRCFDRECFKLKRSIGVLDKIKKLVADKPDTIFVKGYEHNYGKIPKNIASFLSSEKIKVLDQNKDEWTTSNWSSSLQKKVQAIVVNGDDMGKPVTAYIAGKKESTAASKAGAVPGEMSAQDRKDAIKRIEERTKRAAELDVEKVFARVLSKVQVHSQWNSVESEYPEQEELALIGLILYNHADYQIKEKFNKVLKFKAREAKKELEEFRSLTVQQLAYMARVIAVNQYTSPYNADKVEGLLICELAQDYHVEVEDMKAEQAEIRAKREAKAKERIAELKKPAKDTSKKKIRKGLSALLDK